MTDREVVMKMFAAIEAGDPEGAVEFAHPEVEWAPTAWSGTSTLRGKEAIRSWLAQFGPKLERLRIELEPVAEADGWVVVLGTIHDTRDGGSFALRVGWNFAVEDGMVLDGRAYETWEQAREAGAPRSS